MILDAIALVLVIAAVAALLTKRYRLGVVAFAALVVLMLSVPELTRDVANGFEDGFQATLVKLGAGAA